MKPKIIRVLACAMVVAFSAEVANAQTSPFTKAQVADRIRKVEDGVDEFRKYLETRGDDARSRAQSAQNNGTTTRRSQANPSNTQARQDQAKQTKMIWKTLWTTSIGPQTGSGVSSIRPPITWRPESRWNRSWIARDASTKS